MKKGDLLHLPLQRKSPLTTIITLQQPSKPPFFNFLTTSGHTASRHPTLSHLQTPHHLKNHSFRLHLHTTTTTSNPSSINRHHYKPHDSFSRSTILYADDTFHHQQNPPSPTSSFTLHNSITTHHNLQHLRRPHISAVHATTNHHKASKEILSPFSCRYGSQFSNGFKRTTEFVR